MELQFVVPFVVKVLEATKKSRIFQLRLPTDDAVADDPHGRIKVVASGNAWTLGVMNTLMELYKSPDATLNLKFEVEILCKEHLKLELDQFEPAEPFLSVLTNAAPSESKNLNASLNCVELSFAFCIPSATSNKTSSVLLNDPSVFLS